MNPRGLELLYRLYGQSNLGSYSQQAKCFGKVPRFRCRHCHKTFSLQTFSIDYYAKHRVDYKEIFKSLVICAELRDQMRLNEDFAGSQYYSNNVNILVGSKTEMVHGMGLSVLRRKGSMTDEQKQKREVFEQKGIADPKDTQNSVTSLLNDLCSALGTRRSILNPLFPVNYVDRQFRKDLANHHRETVQYARCPQAMMNRMAVYLLYHNYISPRRIHLFRRGNISGRGQACGLSLKRIRRVIGEHWGRRPFLSKVNLWEQERKTWLQLWRNPGVEFGRYVPTFSAA